LERTPGSGKDHIGFHALTQAALRGVVRAAMDKVCRMGHLPGDHHFYVTFRTRTQGVQMDDSLKDRFPDEMTIVIQHQYSDFKVFDERFEIGLSFGGQLQHLRVPFGAVTRFFDPSTNFGVQMEALEGRANDGAPTIIPEHKLGPDGATPPAAPAAPPEGSVVSLDAFRRK
jgi:hypothetical protein